MDRAATDLGQTAHTATSLTPKSQTGPEGGPVVASSPDLPTQPHPQSDSSGQQQAGTETTSDSSAPLPPPPPPHPPPFSHPPPFPHPPPPTTNGMSSDVSVTSPSQSAISGDMEAEEEEQEEEEGEGDDSQESVEFPRKVPILRLKKKGDDVNVVFEKQDASKNDSYCWVCHDGGDVLCCDRCPRVFHVQCSGLPKAPEGEEEWFCPVCKNIDKRTKRSRPANLKELLLLAVKRMMFPGTEIFQKPVPDDIMKHYKEYIFFPMYLDKIKEKVETSRYQTTRQFLHDTEWILHNCIIYNGAKHALTKIAKGIVKVCKEDMREIELCPSCYKLTVLQPEDWFCTPCSTPHRVVLAKVRGYPLWPAKLISETTDKCDVRFFGQHDRSLVPKSCIQELTGPPPTPSSKTQYWNIAMYELRKYRENIGAMYQQIGGPAKAAAVASLEALEKVGKPAKEPKPKARGEGKGQKSGLEENHYSGEKGYGVQEGPPNHQRHHQLHISNYIPFSPQLVEVIPSMSETDDGSVHGNAATLMEDSPLASEPSSPGSEGDLQIDLSAGKKRERVSPLKTVRTVPPENKSIMGFRRKTHNSLQSMLDNVERNSHPSPAPPLPPSVVAVPGGRVGVVGGAKGKKRGLEGVVRTLSKRLAMSSEDVEGEGEEGEEAHPLFSSSYYEQGKTAIAEIDPEPKRPVRKVKKPGDRESEPSPKKMARAQNAKTVTPLATPEPVPVPVPVPVSVPVSAPSLLPHHMAPAQATSSRTPPPASLRVEIPRTKGKASNSAAGKKRGRPPKPVRSSKSQPPSTMTPTPTATPTTATLSQEAHEPQAQHALAPPGPSLVRGEEGEGDGEGEGEVVEGSGLFAETRRKVERSFRSRLMQLSSPAEDLGYQYFVEKLMSSIKTVLIEMLSQFEAKGKMGAKVIREQLHSAWPVPGSRTVQEQLRKELLQQLNHELEVVRAAAELEREQVVSEVRRQVRQQAELEKELAIAETKKKKWCSYCAKEAQYNCCWNANYCNETCQQAHWPEHMKNCVQIRQNQPLPSTPTVDSLQTPAGKTPVPPTLPPSGTPTDSQTFVFAPPPRPSSGHLIMQQGPSGPSISMPVQPSPREVGGGPEHMLQYAEPVHPDQSGLEQSMTRIEHVPNESAIPSSAHRTVASASPSGQHMKTLILAHQPQPQAQPQQGGGAVAGPSVQLRAAQHQHLSMAKSSVIAGTTPTLIRHAPSASLYQPLMAQVVESSSLAPTARDSSPHTLPNSHPGLQPPPMSPGSPASENPPSVHNPPGFSWPYQQPVIISSTEGYHVPLLPTLQSSTSTSQPYFKAF